MTCAVFREKNDPKVWVREGIFCQRSSEATMAIMIASGSIPDEMISLLRLNALPSSILPLLSDPLPPREDPTCLGESASGTATFPRRAFVVAAAARMEVGLRLWRFYWNGSTSVSHLITPRQPTESSKTQPWSIRLGRRKTHWF